MRIALKTATLLGTLAVVALGAALFGSPSPTPASAGPQSVVLLNSTLCVALGSAFGGLPTTNAASDCGAMGNQWTNGYGSMQDYVRCLRGYNADDGSRVCLEDKGANNPYKVLPSDLAGLDLDKNQIHPGNTLLIFLFVNDDAQVRFITDKGVFLDWGPANLPIGRDYGCNGPTVGPADNAVGDPDCDGNKTAFNSIGDGVVVAHLQVPVGEEPGVGHITAIQGGVGIPVDFNVVGVPDTITLTPLFGKNVIQTGATVPPAVGSSDPVLPTDCKFGASLGAVLAAIGKAEQTIVVAKSLDSDGNEVVGSLLKWDHVFGAASETDQGGVALPQTPTIDLGSVGIGFVQFVCGGAKTGDLKLQATFDRTLDPYVDPACGTTVNLSCQAHAEITIKVVGPPASMTLSADPPVIACDGTTSSKVTAKVATADGGDVANGVDVSFGVQVLGTAKPLKADTAAGAASSAITPLSGAGADPVGAKGVPVIVTAGDVQSSILIQCSNLPAPAPGAGAAPGGSTPSGGAGAGGSAPKGTIGGPDTGSGGQGSGGGVSWWPVLGLAAAGLTLVGTRTVLFRRR